MSVENIVNINESNLQQVLEPVSYTHLDVYKRQRKIARKLI